MGDGIRNTGTERPAGANLRSIVLMIAAMGCFTLADLLIKIAKAHPKIAKEMSV